MLSVMASLGIFGRKCSGSKQATPHSVDGVCGNENLGELWADKFKSLYTSSNPNVSRLLAQALVDLEVSLRTAPLSNSQLTRSLLL